MEINIDELKSLAELIIKKQRIIVDYGDESITLRAQAKSNSGVLLKPLEVCIAGQTIRIDQVGVYKCANKKIWVVKE